MTLLNQKIRTKNFLLSVISAGSQDAKKLAIVLPGRLDTKDYPHMISHVELLAQLGFLALSFDPPGTWESDGPDELYSMSNYLVAINELIEHFGNKSTLLLGHSRGGSMAMLGATKNKNVIGFISIMSRATFRSGKIDEEWRLAGKKTFKRDMPSDSSKSRKYVLPFSFVEDSEQYDMREGVKGLSIPKLFVAGKDDDTVPPSLVEEGYKAAGEPKEFVLLDSDHDYRHHPKIISEINDIISNFITIHADLC
jgi:pimeloyl-ACP methyl ester carboxylesterase